MSAKKAASSRHTSQAKVDVSDSPQTPAARRSAEAQLGTLIDTYAPSHLRLIGAIRRTLRKQLPTAHEVVYEYNGFFVISFSPNDHGYEGLMGIRACENDIRLFFNGGHELPDPSKLLKGSGKQTRWIPVEAASELTRPEVVNLINETIKRNRVPFATSGRGAIVIRLTSAAKRGSRG